MHILLKTSCITPGRLYLLFLPKISEKLQCIKTFNIHSLPKTVYCRGNIKPLCT